MGYKVWSKHKANVTAEVLGTVDEAGRVPAYVTDPDLATEPIAAAIVLNEWSRHEVVPVPLSVPDVGYLVIYGDDPAEPKYEFFDNEPDASKALVRNTKAFGYTPVTVSRNSMITP